MVNSHRKYIPGTGKSAPAPDCKKLAVFSKQGFFLMDLIAKYDYFHTGMHNTVRGTKPDFEQNNRRGRTRVYYVPDRILPVSPVSYPPSRPRIPLNTGERIASMSAARRGSPA